MKLAIYVGVITFLVDSIYKSYTWINSYFWLKRFWKRKTYDSQPSEDGDVPNIILFIPALREQSIVKETINYFKNFRYPKNRLSVVFITTEKENYQKQVRENDIEAFLILNKKNASIRKLEETNRGLFPRTKLREILDLIYIYRDDSDELLKQVMKLYRELPSTLGLIKKEIDVVEEDVENASFYSIHYPNRTGNKPEQLNYALTNFEELLNKELRDNLTYIGVYDFDARPDLRTGELIIEEIANRNNKGLKPPAMIQQIQVPFSNLDELYKKELHGLLLRGNATLYLKRVLGIELYKFRKVLEINNKKIPSIIKAILRPVIYGIGSGMFINLISLKKIGGFPEPLEDLATGYRLSLLGEEIVPLPVFNMMEAYDSYNQMSNSGSICFLGAMRIWRDYNFVNSIDNSRRLTKFEKMALVCKEWIESSIWFVGLPILLIMSLLAINYIDNGFLLLIFLGSPIIIRYFLDTLLLQRSLTEICKNYEGIDIKRIDISFINRIIIILTSPIQDLVRILAPLKGIKRVLMISIFNKREEQTKTER